MSSEGQREYVSPGEGAEILRISPKTLSRWADLGWISCAVTLGGHRRFPRDEIEAIEAELARSNGSRRFLRQKRSRVQDRVGQAVS